MERSGIAVRRSALFYLFSASNGEKVSISTGETRLSLSTQQPHPRAT